MTTTTNDTTTELVNMLAALIDGRGLPHSESRAFDEFSARIGAHLEHATPLDRQRLGMLALGLLIDAGRAKIASDAVLANFGRDAFER